MIKKSLILTSLLISGSLWAESCNFFYDDTGELKETNITEASPNNEGWYSGVWKLFNGALKSQGKYQYKNNFYKYYYETGELYVEANVVDCLNAGSYKQYYKNGNIKNEGVFEKNKTIGLWKFYFQNGILSREGNYIDKQREGIWKYYNKSGNIKFIENYLNDEKDGKHEIYYSDGSLARKAFYKDGWEDGQVVSFYRNGNISKKINYREGDKYGFSEYFRENGTREEGNYVQDEKEGVWKTYNREGEKTLETLFNMGEVTGYPCRSEFCPYRILSYKSPIYPKKALAREGQGCVMMEFTLSKEGNPVEEKILWSKAGSKKTKYLSDNIFDEAALESLRTYKYRPKHIDGVPVEVKAVKSTIVFRIDGFDKDTIPKECAG